MSAEKTALSLVEKYSEMECGKHWDDIMVCDHIAKACAIIAEEYADDECLAFGNFILDNNYTITHWLGQKYFTKGDGIENYKTPSQIYSLYLKSKQP
jgi:hypothetical protein